MNVVMRHKSRRFVRLTTLISVLGLTYNCPASPETWIAGPDSTVQFRLLSNEGRLKFSVSSRTNLIIEPSAMQLTVDGVDLTEGAEVRPPELYRVNETYPWLGAHARSTEEFLKRKQYVRAIDELRAWQREFPADKIVAEGQTLLDLVCSLDLEPARVAAELDGRIVKRDRWAETPLRAGARLELVHFVGGG